MSIRLIGCDFCYRISIQEWFVAVEKLKSLEKKKCAEGKQWSTTRYEFNLWLSF